MVQGPEYMTEDVPDVLRVMQEMDQSLRDLGPLRAFSDLFLEADVEDVKELITSLDTSNLESRYLAISKCVNKAIHMRAEARKRGHDKLINIVKETTSYLATSAFSDKKGTMSWDALSTLLLNLVQSKGAEARNPNVRDVSAAMRGSRME